MADFSTPSQTDLNSLYGAWNPLSYIKGYENQSLADQYRQGAMQQQSLTNQGLANTNDRFSQMTPLEVAGKQATVQGDQIKNQQAGLQLASAQDLYPEQQEYLHKQIATKLSDEDLVAASNKYLKDYNDEVAQNGIGSPKAIRLSSVLTTLAGAAASKAGDRVAQMRDVDSTNRARIQEAGIGANATTNAAGIHVGGQTAAALIGEQWHNRQADLHQQMQNAVIQAINDQNLPPEEKEQRLLRAMQIGAPSYAAAVNYGELQNGNLQNNAIPDNNTGTGKTKSGTTFRVISSPMK